MFQIKYTWIVDSQQKEEYQQFDQNNENYTVTWEPIPNVPIIPRESISEELEALLYEKQIDD
jgi:hypothetical protein